MYDTVDAIDAVAPSPPARGGYNGRHILYVPRDIREIRTPMSQTFGLKRVAYNSPCSRVPFKAKKHSCVIWLDIEQRASVADERLSVIFPTLSRACC